MPKIDSLRYEVSIDLCVIIFTSIMLSLAENAFQNDKEIHIEETVELLFIIVVHSPAKTIGLLEEDIH